MRAKTSVKHQLVTWGLLAGVACALAPACADESPGVSPDGDAGADSARVGEHSEGGYGGEALAKLSAVATLGTDGGALTIDVASLTIPPGALTAEVEIRVAELSSSATNGLPPTGGGVALESRPVAFEPHGQGFARPVTIQLGYPPGASSSFAVMRLANPDDDSWEFVGGASFNDGKATFTVTSFSIYAVFADPEGAAENLYGEVVTSPLCGNGVIDAEEGCDFGDAPPDDGCSATCTVEAGYACDELGCTLLCGNDVVDAGEECEDTEGPWSCDPDCSFVVCGDGHPNVPAGEICDTAGMSATCDDDCTAPGCGDGTVNPFVGEECEGESCDPDCSFVVCGDDYLNTGAGEQCDFGDLLPGDGCSATCTVEPGFTCDAIGCTPTLCGNGTVDAPETCDDNGVNTDGCDSDCTAPACGDGITNPFAGEECDTLGDVMTCDSDCTLPVCGDGWANLAAGEDCDGSGVDTETCDADCSLAECGDVYTNLQANEDCDDGNTDDLDGCMNNCRYP